MSCVSCFNSQGQPEQAVSLLFFSRPDPPRRSAGWVQVQGITEISLIVHA